MLQEAIRTYKGTVCLVSHDVEFLRGAAETILEMTPHRARLFPGNYDYCREKLAEEAAAANHPAQAAAAAPKNAAAEETSGERNQKEVRREKARRRAELAPEKKRLEREVAKLEKQIGDWEAEKAELIEILSNPTPETDFSGLQKKLKNLDYDISRATIGWEETAEKLQTLLAEYEQF